MMDAKNVILSELLAIRKKYENSEEFFRRTKNEDGQEEAEEIWRTMDRIIDMVSYEDFRTVRKG